jgi:hypothetical protein
VGDVVESPITGPAGNVEFLLLLRTPPVWTAEGPAIGEAGPDGAEDDGGTEDDGGAVEQKQGDAG